MDVSETSVAVYEASGAPTRAAPVSAATFTFGNLPASSSAPAAPLAVAVAASSQLPTLMGEVTLKTRSMFRNRSGRPRSETRSAGETVSAPSPTSRLVRASLSFPAARAASESAADAPPRPPAKG